MHRERKWKLLKESAAQEIFNTTRSVVFSRGFRVSWNSRGSFAARIENRFFREPLKGRDLIESTNSASRYRNSSAGAVSIFQTEATEVIND
jgi:hypothetical protein